MSYILDALKKSDQQRQRGSTPTLQAAQLTVTATKRPLLIYYIVIATVLIFAGIMIGWLLQRQAVPALTKPASPEPASIAAESPIPISQQAVPAVPSNMSGKTARPGGTTPVAEIPVKPAGAAPQPDAIPMIELPPAIQQELPAMTIQLHAYSSNPGDRLVSINSIRLREGGSLMLGLKLEQITPDGMIFSYKGYRFQRAIR